MTNYTTGHCANHSKPGGCQLHNLQCGWPNCDRRPTDTVIASSGDSASLGKRARAEELLRLYAEPIPVAVEDGAWFMVREQDALDAITAALATQQGVGDG